MGTPNTWASSPEHPGYCFKTIERGGCTITLLRPELEPKERQKREAHTQAVAERVLRDYYIRKEKQNNE